MYDNSCISSISCFSFYFVKWLSFLKYVLCPRHAHYNLIKNTTTRKLILHFSPSLDFTKKMHHESRVQTLKTRKAFFRNKLGPDCFFNSWEMSMSKNIFTWKNLSRGAVCAFKTKARVSFLCDLIFPAIKKSYMEFGVVRSTRDLIRFRNDSISEFYPCLRNTRKAVRIHIVLYYSSLTKCSPLKKPKHSTIKSLKK